MVVLCCSVVLEVGLPVKELSPSPPPPLPLLLSSIVMPPAPPPLLPMKLACVAGLVAGKACTEVALSGLLAGSPGSC